MVIDSVSTAAPTPITFIFRQIFTAYLCHSNMFSPSFQKNSEKTFFLPVLATFPNTPVVFL